jgi:hypothetical protein
VIGLLAAAALHVTGPERFFCDDLHRMTLRECVFLTRRWICSPEDVGDEVDTMPLYHQTVVEERRLVCHRHHHRRA